MAWTDWKRHYQVKVLHVQFVDPLRRDVFEEMHLFEERPLQDIAKSVKAVNLRRHAIIRKQIPLCRKHHLDIRETDQTN